MRAIGARAWSTEAQQLQTAPLKRANSSNNHCGICRRRGLVVCCDGCPRVLHLSCLPPGLSPPTSVLHADAWMCERCQARSRRKLKSQQQQQLTKKRALELQDKVVAKKRARELEGRSGEIVGKKGRMEEERKQRIIEQKHRRQSARQATTHCHLFRGQHMRTLYTSRVRGVKVVEGNGVVSSLHKSTALANIKMERARTTAARRERSDERRGERDERRETRETRAAEERSRRRGVQA
jgi:hypothetical protein